MPFFSVARMVEASRRFGLQVEVVPGAETRGSASFQPYGLVGHHTAGPKTGDRPSLNICVNGRSDLAGPLCNDFLARSGTNVIVAAGRANHAGAGGFRGLVGNSAVWGIEAEDDGDGVWTAAQVDAYPRLVAARLSLINRDASWYCAHRDWAPTRKVDPTGIDDTWMRTNVARLLAAGGAEEDFLVAVNATQAEWDSVVKAAGQINATIGSGQRSFEGTVEAILSTVQALVNLENADAAQTRALGTQLGDTKTAVLAALAALPTGGLSDEQRAQLAADIATAVNQAGVQVDTGAIAAALSADLAGRLAS